MNYINPYDFIRPMLASPVPNIAAGIQTGMALKKLGPELEHAEALNELRREETARIKRANMEYNNLMAPGGISFDKPITTEQAFKMQAAGMSPDSLLRVEELGKKRAAGQQFAEALSRRMAPMETTTQVPVPGSDEWQMVGVPASTKEITTTVPAKPISAEEIIMMRLSIPEFQAEAAKELATLANLERAAKTAENTALRDYSMQLYRDKQLEIMQQNADANTRRADAAAARSGGAANQGTYQHILNDADGRPLLLNNKTGVITKAAGYEGKVTPKAAGSGGIIDLFNKVKEEDEGLSDGGGLGDTIRRLFGGGSKTAPPAKTNMPPDAKPAPDGKWYRPDPSRKGKWLLIEGM